MPATARAPKPSSRRTAAKLRAAPKPRASSPRAPKAGHIPSANGHAPLPKRTYSVEEWDKLPPAKQRAIMERQRKTMKAAFERIDERFRQLGIEPYTLEEILTLGREDDDDR